MATEKISEHWSKGVASLLWPVLGFVVLVAFWKPLHDIANRIPDVIDKSQTINISGIKFELDSASRFRKPSPPVAKAMKELYAEDLKVLLTSPDTALFSSPERVSEYRERYAHLIQLELVRESESTMVVQGANGTPDRKGFTFKLTTIGAETKAYLIDIIVSTLLGSGSKQGKEGS